MTYLVDANVLSELARAAPAPNVVEWLRENETDFVVTPIVLGEIEYGILLLDDGRQKRALLKWFEDRVATLAVLDFDRNTAREWARLLSRLKAKGTPMPVKDSLIAASALQHDLTVATRNTADFANAGVKVLNPFR